MQFGCKPCSVSVAFGVKDVEGPCCVFVGIGDVAGAMPVELHFAQRVSGVRADFVLAANEPGACCKSKNTGLQEPEKGPRRHTLCTTRSVAPCMEPRLNGMNSSGRLDLHEGGLAGVEGFTPVPSALQRGQPGRMIF